MNLSKRTAIAITLSVLVPFLNACKELEQESNNTATENFTSQPVDNETTQPQFQPIQINVAPTDQSGYPGSGVTFSVTATSAAPLSYQWFYEGTPIAGATSATLPLFVDGVENAGTYSVEISNYSTSVNAAAQLLVNSLPEINTEPQDVYVYPGESATFSVSASGDNIEYQWQSRTLFGWQTLTEETSNTLVIDDVSTSTGKQYRVKVKNDGGQKTSRTTRINLKNAISISSQPADQQIAAGENATFSVSASGYGTLSYQWYRAGSAISNSSKFQGVDSANLSVLNATSSDASLYYVVINNGEGQSATSNSAALSVQGPVAITVQPASKTLYSGQAGSLVIAASGTNPMAFQWQKWNGSNWTNISGATAATLNFASVSDSTAGRYRCAVSNEVSSAVTSEATVTVLAAASISQSPASQSVNVGESAQFTVVASGDDINYEWTKNGQVITGSGNTLSFASVRELDEATYGCRVYNEGGSQSCANFKLTVNAAVSITTQPTSQSTYEGGSVSLAVVATGDPLPTVEWYHNEELVSTGNVLNLNYVTAEQAGSYQCLVKNTISTLYCAPVLVSVAESVTITSQPQNTAADEGSSLTLTVAANGENLNYEWFKDGQSIGNNSSTLTLADLNADNAGTYSCRAWNDFSSADCSSFTLSINGFIAITKQPQGLTAYEDDSATLQVSHDGGSDAQISWYFNDTLTGNGPTLTLSPLTMEKAGEYRCVVSNSVNSVACNSVTVSVLEKVRITKQPGNVLTDSGETVSISIEATGQAPLQYSCSNDAGVTLTGSSPAELVINAIAKTQEGEYTCTVSNAGSSITSQVFTVSVNEQQATPVSLSITWDAPKLRTNGTNIASGELQGYKVYLAQSTEGPFELAEFVTTNSALLTVNPGEYFFCISAVNSNDDEGEMSTPVYINVQ